MAYIKGISYYLPERVVTNEELIKDFPEWSVDKVAQKVGVDSRHLAAENETAGDMAIKAANKGESEIIIAKHRNGPVGTVKLLFQGNITKFKNPIKTDAF